MVNVFILVVYEEMNTTSTVIHIFCKVYFVFTYVYVCLSMYVYEDICGMPKEDVKLPEVEVVGGCEPHNRYGLWELNLGFVQEQ